MRRFMPKDDDSNPQPPKFSFEEEFRTEHRKVVDLETSNSQKDTKIDSLQAEIRKLRKETGAQSEPKPDVATTKAGEPPAPVPKIDEPKHAMSITDDFCPTCGEANQEWKDETECADCKHPLGAVATLGKVKNCPGCGHTSSSKTPDGRLAVMKKGVKVPA
jgi:hypothetical protein